MGSFLPKVKIIPQDLKGITKYENLNFYRKDLGRYMGKHPFGTAACLLK